MQYCRKLKKGRFIAETSRDFMLVENAEFVNLTTGITEHFLRLIAFKINVLVRECPIEEQRSVSTLNET